MIVPMADIAQPLDSNHWIEGMGFAESISVIECWDGEEPTEEEHKMAWVWLIDSGDCWGLQGRYGRAAAQMIDDGTYKEWRTEIVEKQMNRRKAELFNKYMR